MVSEKFWHLKTGEEVLKELQSSKEQGISEEEAKKRLRTYGKNSLPSEESFKWLQALFGKFKSVLIFIMAGAAIVASAFGQWLEFIIIIIIILMTVFLGFYQEYKADSTIKALNKLTAKKVFVLRNGNKKEIDSEDLAVGDIVFLKRGDIVPADIRILEAHGLQIIESYITGESKERIKTTENINDEKIGLGDMDNMAFSSTHVICGKGVGVVVETGLSTVIGKISSSIKKIKPKKSPIQKKIDLMSKRISYIVLVVASILFFVLLLQGNGFYFSILLVSAVAISGIPESLPLCLTLTFSNGVKKMAKKNAIVKDLNSVETLGTATVICTDKTGTLTENKMRVSQLFLPDGRVYTVTGTGYEPVNKFFKNEKEIDISEIKVSEELLKTMVLCNDSELRHEKGEWIVEGEPTEGAILAFAKSLNIDEMVLKKENKRVHVVPFDPLIKYMITVNNHISESSKYQFFMKGAGEIVLNKCKYFRDKDGKIKKISPLLRKKIISHLEDCNSKGLRVLSIASKTIKTKSKKKQSIIDDHIQDSYVFEGMLGIEDPIREEVYDAVSLCHKAGIKIVMITGDHKLIAHNIGNKLNLFTHSSAKIMEGFEIDRLSEKELDEVIMDVAIFARATPEHKLRIVESLQRKGQIVAMTGDGVNDAPALKKADIGVAMGKNGTEVAREASNMVLTDDNFATIVNAVSEGRTVYSNIRRFIYYLLTGNFTEVGIIIFAVMLGISLPLTALMILFINVVTSTIPSLALGVEPTNDKVMKQKPRNPRDRLLSGYILTKIVVLIPFLLFGTMSLFMWEIFIGSAALEKARTIAFATIIVFELFHAFNARRLHTTIFEKGFFKNPYIFSAVASSFILMLLTIYSPLGNKIFLTVPLLLNDWIPIILVGSTVVIFSEIIKYSIKSEFKEQSSLQGIKIAIE